MRSAYRAYDAAGALIYVGYTMRYQSRLRDHLRGIRHAGRCQRASKSGDRDRRGAQWGAE